MRIGLAQMSMESDIEANFQKSLAFIRDAAKQGVDIICFPEVQLSPFFAQYEKMDVSRYVIEENSRYISEMKSLCKEKGIYACPNFYIEENGKRYDMSLLIDDKGCIIGRQKMVHIAQCECFYEQDYYTPSEEGFQVFDTKFGKIGIVVCFRVQAFQNSVNIAMCNRVGREDKMIFSGESVVCNYDGDIISAAGSDEILLISEVDLSAASEKREKKPYTSIRRPDLYE